MAEMCSTPCSIAGFRSRVRERSVPAPSPSFSSSGGVADQEVSGRQQDHPAREAQGDRLGLGRHVRPPVAAAQGAIRPVLGLQLRHQPADRVHMPLAGMLRDRIPLRVDHDERRPGPDRVLLPGRELRVVEDGMPHPVPLDRVRHRRVPPRARTSASAHRSRRRCWSASHLC